MPIGYYYVPHYENIDNVFRRQIQGPNLQYQALLDTMVLTERGARLQVLAPDTEVWTSFKSYYILF